MKFFACTLFERNYHFGLSTLVNSLCAHGFKGSFFAGSRGRLPRWAMAAALDSEVKWPGARTVKITDNVDLTFLPLETNCHLTNFKPEFMLNLFAGPAESADALLYLDPDIVVDEDWAYLEDWISCGVALCEDINSPVSSEHPRRIGWRRHFAQQQLHLSNKSEIYVNGGCVGVSKEHVEFLHVWRRVQDEVGNAVGGNAVAKIAGGKSLSYKGFANCFDATDQDALNIAVELCDLPCSILGKEAMAFKPGQAVLPHALGPNKPWNLSYLLSSLRGKPPRLVDKLYWRHANQPIAAYSQSYCLTKRLAITLASFVGRFYSRH